MVSRIEVGWRQGEKEGTIPVDVVYSKRRTIGLEVQADGKVLIRAPKGITKKVLMDFVNDRQEWIVEKWFLIENLSVKYFSERQAEQIKYRHRILPAD